MLLLSASVPGCGRALEAILQISSSSWNPSSGGTTWRWVLCFLAPFLTEILMPDGSNETKAQRVERLKREKNPWECFGEIERFAREGYSSIAPEWLSTYFRWWGVYTQGDGLGVLGGTGGEGKATPYFMVRIRIPN